MKSCKKHYIIPQHIVNHHGENTEFIFLKLEWFQFTVPCEM